MPILLVPPYDPPQLPGARWPGLAAMRWHAWDDTVWDLTGKSGGVALQAGTRGLNMPTWSRFTSQSPATAGSTNRGYRTLEREVYWPIKVFGDGGSQEWLDYDRAFWATMHPGRVGVWEVQQPSGEVRRLRCRFDYDNGHAHRVDPSIVGWEVYALSLVAEQPYWLGEPIVREWTDAGLVPFFGDDGTGGAPFNISSGNTIGSASIANPGDVEAYPVWTLTGPATTVTVGVGDAVIEYNASISPGNTITIDTHPDQLTVLDQDGVDRSANLGVAEFRDAAIPAGAQVDLTLAVAGTGSVKAEIEPNHFKAW